jgi:hypothetical protein
MGVALAIAQMPVSASSGDWWETLPIRAVRVVVHTEGDDKDSEESVTLRVSYGPFSAETTSAAGERWKDQSDNKFEIALPNHPPAGATFELRVSKSREGSPTGKGWKASFEMFALPEGGGEMPLFINGDRNAPRSSIYVMGDGEQNPNDVLVMSNAKAVALPGGRGNAPSARATVRFNQAGARSGTASGGRGRSNR